MSSGINEIASAITPKNIEAIVKVHDAGCFEKRDIMNNITAIASPPNVYP